MHSTNRFVEDVAVTGASAAFATTVVIPLCGRREGLTAAAPLNAVSHIVWGDRAAAHDEPSWQYTGLGTTLNAAAMVGWSAIFQVLAGERRTRTITRSIAAAMATTATAYIIDYHVVPDRLTPGFEKRLSSGSLCAIYFALAAGLVAGDRVAQRRVNRIERARRPDVEAHAPNQARCTNGNDGRPTHVASRSLRVL